MSVRARSFPAGHDDPLDIVTVNYLRLAKLLNRRRDFGQRKREQEQPLGIWRQIVQRELGDIRQGGVRPGTQS